MECTLEPEKNSRSHLTSGMIDGRISLRAAQSKKLGDRLKYDRPKLSYADVHPELLKQKGVIQPKTASIHQKLDTDRKSIENEELVKYMSSLPGYLEKGETPKEKAFSVGVLDWRRLENWQHKLSQIDCRTEGFSPSSSNTSSFYSTEESSSNSSRGHSCSPAHQWNHRATFQSHLNVSPHKDSSHDVKSFTGTQGNEKNLKPGAVESLYIEQRVHRAYQSFDENRQSHLKGLSKAVDPQHTSDIRRSLDIDTHARASTSKGKMKIQDGESLSKEEDELVVSRCGVDDFECMEGHKKGVLPVSEADQENSTCSTSCHHDSSTKGRIVKSSRHSFSNGSNSMVYSGHMAAGIARAHEADALRHLKTENVSSIDAKDSKSSSEMTQPSAYSRKILTSPPRENNLQEKKSTVMLTKPTKPDPSEGSNQNNGTSETMRVRYPSPKKSTVMLTNPTAPDPSERSDQNNGTSETIKVRNSSPTRRFSTAMSRIGRISGKKDTTGTPQGVKQPTAKSVPERAQTSIDSGCDKSESTGRARSSPLRRLLNPLLKPKTGNSDHVIGSSERELPSMDKHRKVSTKRGESPTKRSLKVKLDLRSCKSIEIDDPCSNVKCGPTMLQALLQVKVRDGLPLFTFAVDNESDILAATMKKVGSSLKENSSCIYTFFTIREAKKKSGNWLYQGGKEKCHRILPNIVGKMKVSEVPSSGLNEHIFDSPFRIKEFVLLSTYTRHPGLQTSDLQQNDELAAIVVKLPNRGTSNSDQSDHQDGNQKNISVSGLANHPEGISQCTDSCNEDISMTVILPGGAHGQPSKGEASSLVARWKSGGSCDCGGWDLGCKLTLLVNHTNHQRKSSSAKAALAAEKFELFTKGEVQDSKPIFSLSQFKDGIFSVEFSSSLKVRQAFTICIAVLNARNQEKFSELANLIAEDTCEGTMFPEVLEEGAQVELPTKFVSIPPLSPVGRV